MASLVATTFLSLIFLIYISWTVSAQSNSVVNFTFNEDLEGMTSDLWRWSDREALPWGVPSGGDGFAVFYGVGQGDKVYPRHVSLEHGLSYSIKYFVSSKHEQKVTFALHKLTKNGKFLEVIEEFPRNTEQSNDEWIFVTGYIEPDSDAVVSMFCSASDQPTLKGTLGGCVVDEVTFTYAVDPEILKEKDATKTTSHKGKLAVFATFETTLPVIDFNFDYSTSGWTLGRSNGASWRRISAANAAVLPPENSYILFLSANDVVSSTVMATSPRMIAGSTGEISIAVNFFMQGSPEYPAFLKVRRASSYTTFDADPALSMDGFGEQANQNWLNHGGVFPITPGEEFFIVLEGSLGIDNLQNQVGVTTIRLTGALPYPVPEAEFFDFSLGLQGWTMGNVDGGKWSVQRYADIDGIYNIPVPTDGPDTSVLWTQSFDIHSGVISIDSPPIAVQPDTSKHLDIRFWIGGSDSYPTSLRIRRKMIDGVYDYLPFLDLSGYGDDSNQEWINFNTSYLIPTNGITEYFQLVIEADLGSGMYNAVAIDSISITTRDIGSEGTS